jgi:hypothetical protein
MGDDIQSVLRDSAVEVNIHAQERLATAFYNYDQYRFAHRGPSGADAPEQSRTILQVGRVVAVMWSR